MHVGLGKIAGVDVAGNHHACGDGVLVRHLVEQLSRFRKFLTRKLERNVWGSNDTGINGFLGVEVGIKERFWGFIHSGSWSFKFEERF
ncbi:hypothetical protein ACFX1Q_024078 [Malus domestica]